MELNVLNEQGLEAAKLAASDAVFGREYNEALVYTAFFFFAEHFLPTFLPRFGIAPEASKVAGLQMLLNICCIVINATLIFGCYMWICLEGDEDMPDNRKRKYKTPFDYFDRAKAEAELSKTAQTNGNHGHKHKKK